MIKKILFLIVLIFIVNPAYADTDITLAWSYSETDEANIDGFRLFMAETENPATWEVLIESIDSNARSVDVTILAGVDKACFMLRAFNEAGESENSNVPCWEAAPINPPPVTDLRIE